MVATATKGLETVVEGAHDACLVLGWRSNFDSVIGFANGLDLSSPGAASVVNVITLQGGEIIFRYNSSLAAWTVQSASSVSPTAIPTRSTSPRSPIISRLRIPFPWPTPSSIGWLPPPAYGGLSPGPMMVSATG